MIERLFKNLANFAKNKLPKVPWNFYKCSLAITRVLKKKEIVQRYIFLLELKYRVREKQTHAIMRSQGDTERYCVVENLKRPPTHTRQRQRSLSAYAALVSETIIHARLVDERCNKRGPGIYASAGSCIAPRRGRGIRLIILIAPSTPFLCARQASSSRRSLARALPSRARA